MRSYGVVHSSQVPRAAMDPQTLGYLYNNGGLNNQKMALVGLLVAGLERRRAINLPYIHIRDQRITDEYLARFEDVFALDAVMAFGRRHDLTVHHHCPGGERGGWDHFMRFGELLTPDADVGLARALLDALGSLRPRITSAPVFLRLKAFVCGALGMQTAIQLRIERDWQEHAANLRPMIGGAEDYALGFADILAKVRRTFPALRLAYVVADENAMPASADEIRRFSRRQFGIDLLWKSDLLSGAELAALNPLDLSLMDFEIAKCCPQFIGLSNSTFSNVLCLEQFARSRQPVRGQFIYNCLGQVVQERRDNGFTVAAAAAVLPCAAAERLIEDAVVADPLR